MRSFQMLVFLIEYHQNEYVTSLKVTGPHDWNKFDIPTMSTILFLQTKGSPPVRHIHVSLSLLVIPIREVNRFTISMWVGLHPCARRTNHCSHFRSPDTVLHTAYTSISTERKSVINSMVHLIKNAYIQARKHIHVHMTSHSVVCATLQSAQKGAHCFKMPGNRM